MTFLTPDELRRGARGEWMALPAAPGAPLAGVSTDTRTLQAGEAFVAIRGERFDGHGFLAQARARGAPVAIVERTRPRVGGAPEGLGLIGVDDSRRALGRLARAWRMSLGATRVVGVTGSSGKTTSVRMLGAILSRAQRGVASRASYNNDIGVPLTILRARRGDQYLVCEVGTSRPGEIERLGDIVRPHVGVITSIGHAHVAELGSIEGVAREKASLLGHLEAGGVAIVPHDCSVLDPHLAGVRRVIRVGTGVGADVRVSACEARGRGIRFTLGSARAGRTFDLPLAGEHNALNAAMAITAGWRLGVDDATIRDALASLEAPEMRMEVVDLELEGERVRVVNDAYNANPESMLAAVRAMRELGAGFDARVVILGDMLELGPVSKAKHVELGEAIAREGTLDRAILVGPEMAFAAGRLREAWGVRRVRHWGSLSARAIGSIAGSISGGEAVLVKASRGMGLERVARAILERAPARGSDPARVAV